MNLRTTPLLFGLLLGILGLFGLMLAYKKTAPDENAVVPSMKGPEVKIDTVVVKRKDQEDLVFTEANEMWYVQQQGHKVRVEGFKIDQIVKETQNARRYEEVKASDDLAGNGLTNPRITVTFKGKVKDKEKEWKLNVGNQDAANFFVYVSSSDRPERAVPVPRSTLDALFFKDVAELRSRRLFDFVEPSVSQLDVKAGKEELALKKVENTWLFEKPALGFAGFDAPAKDEPGKAEPGKAEPEKKQDKAGGVRGLINAILGIHLDSEDDFEPLGTDLDARGVADGKETMRIEVGTIPEKSAKAGKDEAEPKTVAKEVLLIGKKVAQTSSKSKLHEAQFYARLLSDQGVFRINAKLLAPIKLALADPARIRSHDVAVYDPKSVDAIAFETTHSAKDAKGKDAVVTEEAKLLHPADKDWQVLSTTDKEKIRKGNDKGIQELIEHLEGKNAIETFADDKDDSWGGLNGPNRTEISVYIKALEGEKKDDKNEKKDDKNEKKGAKKDEKKSLKEAKDKKDEKPAVAVFKKDVKPFVRLTIGTVDKDKKIAQVKRVLQDGTKSRFTVKASYVEKLHLEQGPLAFLDRAIPGQTPSQVAAVDIKRGKDEIELDHASDVKGQRWMLKDVHDRIIGNLANSTKMGELLRDLTGIQATQWVRGDAPEKFGFKDPQAVVTIYSKKGEQLTAVAGATLIGSAAFSAGTVPLLPPFAAILANRFDAPLGEKTTIEFGKEIEEDKQKLVYVKHSGTDLVFLVPAKLVKAIRDADLRDRSAVAHTQPQVDASLMGLAAGPPIDATLLASPLVTGVVHSFDPAKVKLVEISVRTRVELRSFAFQRVGKDKDRTWVDQSGVKEFMLDADKVTQLLEKVCKLKTDRFASFGGPTGENKLTGKEATLRIELTFDDNTSVTLTVGTSFESLGYFAHSSAWEKAVFFVPPTLVDPLLQGAGYFGKDRVAAGP